MVTASKSFCFKSGSEPTINGKLVALHYTDKLHTVLLIHVLTDHLEAQATGKLAKFFGHNKLKEWQMKEIQATIEGKNYAVIHPTGSGESICFQLPHLITGKATIVITPTISLMQDQTTNLQQKGIRASFLGSTQKDPSIMKQFVDGKLDLLFVTVERLFAGSDWQPKQSSQPEIWF